MSKSEYIQLEVYKTKDGKYGMDMMEMLKMQPIMNNQVDRVEAILFEAVLFSLSNDKLIEKEFEPAKDIFQKRFGVTFIERPSRHGVEHE